MMSCIRTCSEETYRTDIVDVDDLYHVAWGLWVLFNNHHMSSWKKKYRDTLSEAGLLVKTTIATYLPLASRVLEIRLRISNQSTLLGLLQSLYKEPALGYAMQAPKRPHFGLFVLIWSALHKSKAVQ